MGQDPRHRVNMGEFKNVPMLVLLLFVLLRSSWASPVATDSDYLSDDELLASLIDLLGEEDAPFDSFEVNNNQLLNENDSVNPNPVNSNAQTGHSPTNPGVQAGNTNLGVKARTTNPGLHAGTTNPGLHAGTTNPGLHAGTTNPGLHAGTTNQGVQAGNTNPGAQTGHTNPGIQTGYINSGVQTGYTNPGVQTGYTNSGVQTGYANPGVQTGYINPGVQTNYTNPGVPTGYTNLGVQTGYTNSGVQAGYTNPGVQTGYTNPGVQASYIDPGVQAVYTNPGVQTDYTNLGVQTGYTNPGVQAVYTHPGVQKGYTNPGLQTGYTNSGVQTGYNNPGVQTVYTNSGVQTGYTKPGVTGYTNPGVQVAYTNPNLQAYYTNPGVQTGHRNPGVQTGHRNPGVQTGHRNPGVQTGHRKPGVQDEPGNKVKWADPVNPEEISKSRTINEMINGTVILTDVITWINENVKSDKFEKTIRELQNLIFQLPSNIGVDRAEIFTRLYKALDRIIITRVMLEDAATKLKENCKDLIQMYDDFDGSMELIQYTAEEFVKFGTTVMEQLDWALGVYGEVGDELSQVIALLETLNSALVEKAKEIQHLKEQQTDVLDQIENVKKRIEKIQEEHRKRNAKLNRDRILVGVFTLGIGSIIAEPVIANIKTKEGRQVAQQMNSLANSKIDFERKIKSNMKELRESNNIISQIQETYSKLSGDVSDMKNYVSEEIELIIVWRSSLNEAVKEHEDGISVGDIKFGIKKIKRKLNVLIQACDDYLNHKMPDSLSRLIDARAEENSENPLAEESSENLLAEE